MEHNLKYYDNNLKTDGAHNNGLLSATTNVNAEKMYDKSTISIYILLNHSPRPDTFTLFYYFVMWFGGRTNIIYLVLIC
jgi:hypothetical protein